MAYENPLAQALRKPPDKSSGGTPFSDKDARDWYARKINQALTSTPLRGTGETFASIGFSRAVDPLFMVAIAGAESRFGTDHMSGDNNPFGLGPGKDFPSFAAAIRYLGDTLSGPYYYGKRTIPEIRTSYAPGGAANDPSGLNSNWVRNVSSFYGQLGGNPNAVVVGVSIAQLKGRITGARDAEGNIVNVPVYFDEKRGGFFPGTGVGEAIEGVAEGVAGAAGDVANALNPMRVLEAAFAWLGGAGLRVLAAIGGIALAVIGFVLMSRTVALPSLK